MVVFATSKCSTSLWAIKFFISQHHFAAERAMYENPLLRAALPAVRAWHILANVIIPFQMLFTALHSGQRACCSVSHSQLLGYFHPVNIVLSCKHLKIFRSDLTQTQIMRLAEAKNPHRQRLRGRRAVTLAVKVSDSHSLHAFCAICLYVLLKNQQKVMFDCECKITDY